MAPDKVGSPSDPKEEDIIIHLDGQIRSSNIYLFNQTQVFFLVKHLKSYPCCGFEDQLCPLFALQSTSVSRNSNSFLHLEWTLRLNRETLNKKSAQSNWKLQQPAPSIHPSIHDAGFWGTKLKIVCSN